MHMQYWFESLTSLSREHTILPMPDFDDFRHIEELNFDHTKVPKSFPA
jgi:hypothetical protein